MVKKRSYSQSEVIYGFWTEICLFAEKTRRSRFANDWSDRLCSNADNILTSYFAQSDRVRRRKGIYVCIITSHQECCRKNNAEIDTVNRLSILENCSRGKPIAMYRTGTGKLRAQECAIRTDFKHSVENQVRRLLVREFGKEKVREEFGKERHRRRATTRLWLHSRYFNSLVSTLLNCSKDMIDYGTPLPRERTRANNNGAASSSSAATTTTASPSSSSSPSASSSASGNSSYSPGSGSLS